MFEKGNRINELAKSNAFSWWKGIDKGILRFLTGSAGGVKLEEGVRVEVVDVSEASRELAGEEIICSEGFG